MKFRNTLILIVAFAVLAGYFFLVERVNDSNPLKRDGSLPQTLTIFDYPDSEVLELVLSGAEKRTVLRRVDENSPWELIGPGEGDVEEDRVNFFVQRFVSLKAERIITGTEVTENLSHYGLETPVARGTMKLKDGREDTIYVGDKTPELTNRYVRVKGDQNSVYLVGVLLPNLIVDFIDRPPRKRTPTPPSTSRLTPSVNLSHTPPISDAVMGTTAATPVDVDTDSP